MSEEFETKSEDIGDESLGGEASSDETVVVEQKKMSTQMMVLVGVVLIGGAVLWFMYGKKGPDSAAAATVTDTSAQQTIETFLSTGKDGVQRMETMLHDTEKLVAKFTDYPKATQVPLSELHTNPFRATGGDNADDDGAKRSREKERQATIKAVSELSLQSVISSGTRRACMINNTLYLEGQQVNSFTVEKITPKAVVVKSGMYRFELKMEK